MAVLAGLAVVVAAVWWVLLARPSRQHDLRQQQEAQALIAAGGDTLIANMITLRAELQTSRRRELVWRAGILIAVAWAVWQTSANAYQNRQFIEQRNESRVARCQSDNKLAEAERLLAQTSADAWQAFAVILIGDQPIEGDLAQQVAAFTANVVRPFSSLAATTGPFRDLDCSLAAIEARSQLTSSRP